MELCAAADTPTGAGPMVARERARRDVGCSSASSAAQQLVAAPCSTGMLHTPVPAVHRPGRKQCGSGMDCGTAVRHVNVRRMPLGAVTKHPGVSNVLQVRRIRLAQCDEPWPFSPAARSPARRCACRDEGCPVDPAPPG